MLLPFRFSSWRSQNIAKHVILSFFYKGMSIVFGFALVPMCIKYLKPETYGVWLTISSFLTWFSFFDVGLGNGLRNRFAEAKALGNIEAIKKYVSAAYTSIGAIAGVLIILFLLVNGFINWGLVFNTKSSLLKDLQVMMPIVFVFFALQLVLKLIITIYVADQIHSVQGQFNFISQGVSLLAVWIMSQYAPSSLLTFGFIFSLIPVCILVVISLIAFTGKYRDLKPIFLFKEKIYVKGIFGLGIKFFIIQLSGLVLFSTGNILISQVLDPGHVVPYSISYQYFGVSNMVFSIILTPYWTSVTDAYHRNEMTWIKQSMKNMIYVSYFFIGLLFVMLFLAPHIYSIWVGDSIEINFSLNVWMTILFMVIVFYSPYTYFINGTGKVKLQMISLLFTALINIPLCLFLVNKMDMGVSGVVAGSVFSLLPHAIISPIQYHKIINQSAHGIWLA
jgi:O-antigen/teichoic acid export membrane protein